jgi:hypothetical protein
MELTIALIGLALTSTASLWKAFSIVSSLEKQVLKLEHHIDRVELLSNGVRERMEHINSRLTNTQREQQRAIDEMEGYLTKNTSYEHRATS